MNQAAVWMIINAVILLIVGMICVVIVMKKGKQDFENYAFFILGVIWFFMGIIFDNVVFMVLGLISFVVGLVKKDKWSDLEYLIEGKFWRIVIIALVLLVLSGVIVSYLVVRQGI